jgi:hypothetical protein
MATFGPTAECACLKAGEYGHEEVAPALAALRNECAALRVVLVPDDSWSAIVADAKSPNAAAHRSYLLLALRRRCLDRVTRPVHRFLMRGQEVRADLTNQYRQDLRERWLFKGDEMERHRRFRQFFGKIVELQVVQWLTDLDWIVTNLEALGHSCDIAADSPDGVSFSIEVKYLGQMDDDFRLVLESMRGTQKAGWFGPYGAINYVLFRAYEVAVSLRAERGRKMAILVIDAQTWPFVEVALSNAWLDWKQPKFIQTEEQDWNQFLESKRRSTYPVIDSELTELVKSLDRVWIAMLGNRYSYTLEHEIQIDTR